MKRAKEIELLTQCLELARSGRAFMTEEETLVPVRSYLDERRFEEERALFRRSMNIVAHRSQIPSPGDFITRDVVGTPVIVVRQRDGSAKAFINVCRHRGATVELRDHGRCKRFVCPYHAWTYETDGSLAGVRHQEGFPGLDADHTSLVELVCSDAAGLVWVCPDPAIREWAADDATRTLIAELEGLLGGDSVVVQSEARVWKANWKLIVDGGLESYHFKIAHRNTIAGFFTDNTATYEFMGDHIRSVLPRTSILTLADRPESEWDIRKHTHVLYAIAPNASLLVQERHFELILTTPISVDQCRIEIMTVAPQPGPDGYSDKAKRFLSANHVFTKQTLDEDFEIAEQIQRGMRTGANEHFRFARFEGALTEWHRRLNEKLGRPVDESPG
jgi:phenylpropionate dioxygenase-like ring-hydroxylating dioxygenase large terminal subunit